MDNQTTKVLFRLIRIVIILAISVVLTFISMEVIKNVPTNSFSSEMSFVATGLLVFGLWFLAIMFLVWFVGFLINLGMSRKSPPSVKMSAVLKKKNKDLRTLVILKKIIIGASNAACLYFLIIFTSMDCVLIGVWASAEISMILVSANVGIMLSLIACALSDFIMMIKLSRNPDNMKVVNIRKKIKKICCILVTLYVCFYVLFLVSLSFIH